MTKENDLQEVMAEETRRGRRPVDVAAQRQRLRLLKAFKEALELGDEEVFKQAIIRELGQRPGSLEYARSLRIWRAFHEKPKK